MTAAIVAHDSTDAFRHHIQLLERLGYGHILELSSRGSVVQVLDVSGMVLAVVYAHGLLVDIRFQGIIRVWQNW